MTTSPANYSSLMVLYLILSNIRAYTSLSNTTLNTRPNFIQRLRSKYLSRDKRSALQMASAAAATRRDALQRAARCQKNKQSYGPLVRGGPTSSASDAVNIWS
eukprot:6208305-Pleurochrysis_carterae.AAC.2